MPFLFSNSLFSSLGSVFVLTIGLTYSSLGAAQTQADVIITNANIYQHKNANAIAIKKGKILAIGSNKELTVQF